MSPHRYQRFAPNTRPQQQKQQPPADSPPPLSPADRKRLRLYLEDCHEDPHALARACGMDLFDILQWLDSPPVRRALALLDKARARAQAAARRRAEAQAAPMRALCILQLAQSLERAMADNRSQTSLRRAAQALLRAMASADPASLHLATLPGALNRLRALTHRDTSPQPADAHPDQTDQPQQQQHQQPSPSPSAATPTATTDSPPPHPTPPTDGTNTTDTNEHDDDPLTRLHDTLATLQRIRGGVPLDIPPDVMAAVTAELTRQEHSPPHRQAG